MIDAVRWLNENTALAWVIVIAVGTALAVLSAYQQRGHRRRDEDFGKEAFARTKDLKAYGLLGGPRRDNDW